MSQHGVTEDRRFVQQCAFVLSARTDDRVRILAVKHCVSYAKVMRVALRLGLPMTERLDSAAFHAEHAREAEEAGRQHADCIGRFHSADG